LTTRALQDCIKISDEWFDQVGIDGCPYCIVLLFPIWIAKFVNCIIDLWALFHEDSWHTCIPFREVHVKPTVTHFCVIMIEIMPLSGGWIYANFDGYIIVESSECSTSGV